MFIIWTDFYFMGSKVLLSMIFSNIFKDISGSKTEQQFLTSCLLLFLWTIILLPFFPVTWECANSDQFLFIAEVDFGTCPTFLIARPYLFILFILLFKVETHHLAFILIKTYYKMMRIKQNDKCAYCPLTVLCSEYVVLFGKKHYSKTLTNRKI